MQGFYGGGGIVSYEGDISSPILEAAWFAGEGWREMGFLPSIPWLPPRSKGIRPFSI